MLHVYRLMEMVISADLTVAYVHLAWSKIEAATFMIIKVHLTWLKLKVQFKFILFDQRAT